MWGGADAPKTMHLFSGAGGSMLADLLLGHRPTVAVEIDRYCRRVLAARIADGCLPPDLEIFDDVRTFDGTPFRGRIDVVAGGFPCQAISVAGLGAGFADERSGLWREMARIIGEVRPEWAFIENVPMLVHRGLRAVLSDLAAMGYDAAWCVLGADAPAVAFSGEAPAIVHTRDRMWILARARADADGSRQQQPSKNRHQAGVRSWRVGPGADADANRSGCQQQRRAGAEAAQYAAVERCNWWSAEPGMGRVAHGVAARVDQLRALGNGWVPAVAALAWWQLMPLLIRDQ